MNKKIFNLLISFCLSLFIFISDSNAKDADGLIKELVNLAERGHEINFDDEAKRFGFKNFSEAVKNYEKEFEAKLSLKEAKSLFNDMLPNEEIRYTKENADKLFNIIINSKYRSAKRYKKKYLKWDVWPEKYKYKGFVITMNIQREFSRITKKPDIKTITAHTWTWWAAHSREGVINKLMNGCKRDIKKYKIPLQECIIIDINEKNVLYEFLPEIRTAAVEEKRIAKKKKMEEKIRILREERKKAEEKAGTKIAKKEPTKKPKKKVAKKPKEEFKPEDKDIDNDAPVIEIAEAITVNDASYEIEGKVTDKSKKIYVEVDGRLVDVKDGNFTVKGYSPVDKEITIEAIDGYGNRSKSKIVKIVIDIKDTDIAEKLEPLNPSKIKTKVSENKVALIIGIENYSDIVKASYAKADAQYFKEYVSKGFGVENKNIKLIVDEEATFIKINKILKKWLVSKIIADKTELIIFYAGHGLASKDGKELYLLPQDGDADLLSISSISRSSLFNEIKNLNPKSVTIFLDACYSGSSRDNEILLADARPVRIVADEQEGIPDNFTIFTASKLNQISSGLKEANHGIFSYYLMKGLEGKADSNKDKQITNGELLAYMDQNVSQKAAELGRQQNPSLSGDPDQVLMRYR